VSDFWVEISHMAAGSISVGCERHLVSVDRTAAVVTGGQSETNYKNYKKNLKASLSCF